MKKILTILAAIAVLGSFALAGCSSTSSSAVSDGFSINVSVENAEAGTTLASDSFTVEEGQVVVFDASNLTEGKLQVELKDGPTVSVSAQDKASFEVPAGEHEAEITVLEKASGSAELRTEVK